ncbi:methyltransferase domain-containing protein [Synechococcus sp. MU1648]|uniref:methyltransferase domain-containing protein n=1 Tax=Synechococcus sp. MU1648 TaxID=2508351 RepID=UPI0020273C36|nr:methyltransferase domain-containing protein [Synechococcus sp. MU1648]
MQNLTISEQQQKLNASLHQDNNYGNRKNAAGLANHLPQILDRLNQLGFCNSFLDYGTGKGKLIQYIRESMKSNITITGYDPAVQEFATIPTGKFDIVSCLDVLEHVELDSIDHVLNEINDLTNNFCYLVIDLQPAVKTLADGRNAHILLAPPDWWQMKISQHFKCFSCFPVYHQSGDIQKVVITATNDNKHLVAMHSFLLKLNIFELTLKGGVLEKKRKYEKKSSK